jgi:hypothetical protein
MLTRAAETSTVIVVFPLPSFPLLTPMVRKVYLKTVYCEAHVTCLVAKGLGIPPRGPQVAPGPLSRNYPSRTAVRPL